MFLNPNNMNFKETVSSNVYVDKTGLIEYTNSVISTTSKFICNSRPRRFEKSMPADMLCAYYSKGCDSKELFMPYHISSSPTFEKYLNQYDVIRIDVQACIALAKGVFNVVDYIENECERLLQESPQFTELQREDHELLDEYPFLNMITDSNGITKALDLNYAETEALARFCLVEDDINCWKRLQMYLLGIAHAMEIIELLKLD